MRLLGHPLHPLLVHFPIAFWVAGTACDVLALLGLEDAWHYGNLLLIAGTICAIPAMIAGFVDLAQQRPAAVSTANRHALLMGASWTVYLAAVIVRNDQWLPKQDPDLFSLCLSITGLAIMALGGWYGAQLVYHHGAGVRPLSTDE
ncbi:MAG: DUF2231 domain-containing protein [Hyphomicrobiaceae bacterium]|nr:DUF2231 domain-containing protein [Hyphomicrobiaceae bacterium]